MYNKNIFLDCSDEKKKSIQLFCEEYKNFLSKGKTERRCVQLSKKLAEDNGFVYLDDVIKSGKKIKAEEATSYIQLIRIKILSYLKLEQNLLLME